MIGGQQLSKTGKGLVFYDLPFWGQEGALMAILLTIAPLVVLWILTQVFPPWDDTHGNGAEAKASGSPKLAGAH